MIYRFTLTHQYKATKDTSTTLKHVSFDLIDFYLETTRSQKLFIFVSFLIKTRCKTIADTRNCNTWPWQCWELPLWDCCIINHIMSSWGNSSLRLRCPSLASDLVSVFQGNGTVNESVANKLQYSESIGENGCLITTGNREARHILVQK